MAPAGGSGGNGGDPNYGGGGDDDDYDSDDANGPAGEIHGSSHGNDGWDLYTRQPYPGRRPQCASSGPPRGTDGWHLTLVDTSAAFQPAMVTPSGLKLEEGTANGDECVEYVMPDFCLAASRIAALFFW